MREYMEIDGRRFHYRKTVPVRKKDGPNGLAPRDARDQAREEARNIRLLGKRVRIIENAEGYGIWEET